jgi:integrase
MAMPAGVTYRSPLAKDEPLLSVLLAEYVSIKSRSKGGWGERSQVELPPYIEFFIEVIGDHPINRVTPEHVRHYRRAQMNNIPARWKSIGSPYRDMNLKQLLKAPIPAGYKKEPNTLSKEFGLVKEFIKWMKQQGYTVDDRLIAILAIKTPPKRATSYDKYQPEHLNLIFGHPGCTKDNFRAAYRFWLPVIGLYTGMRLSEICWLTTDNIMQVDGVWVFKVIKSKGDALPRYIPIHDFLKNDLGFLRYRDWCIAHGHTRLIHGFKIRESGSRFRTPSDWYNQNFLKSLGLKDCNYRLNFHSLRDTFISRAINLGLNYPHIQRVAGHKVDEEKSTTLTHYFDEDVQALYDLVISKLNYDVDLSHLKNSKWVK